jgi:hypothetical protein
MTSTLSIVSICIASAAVLVAIASAAFSAKSASAADKSATAALRLADIAEANDRRARTPKLAVILDSPVQAPGERVIYRIRNESPQLLESVLVHRPPQPDRRIFPIGLTGGAYAEGDEPVQLGPLAFSEEKRMTLHCGAEVVPPEFRVIIECASGADSWSLATVLPPPRGPRPKSFGDPPDPIVTLAQ